MGMTQGEFAEMFDVDEGTVSRWERGRLHPSPSAWRRMRQIAVSSASVTSDVMVKASPVCKYVVPMNDLVHPSTISRGLEEALKRMGISSQELFNGGTLEDRARRAPNYSISGYHALEIIQADKRWTAGAILFAEAHCVSVTLGDVWANMLLAPIPDREEAIMEFVMDAREEHEREGFWVRLITTEDLPRSNR
jgi:transcriptional regulator with XRE-family HTH domain